MKSVTNRALWAKKKNYIKPIVETAQLKPANIVLAGSPGITGGGNTGDLLDPPTGD